MNTNLITRPTPELRVGDVVVTHGMRVLLDTEPSIYDDPNGQQDRRGSVYAFSGLVLNPDEAEAQPNIGNFLRGALHESVWSDELGRRVSVRTNRWTVQGNRFATWAVEVTA